MSKMIFLSMNIHLTQDIQSTNDRRVRKFLKYYCPEGPFCSKGFCICVHALASGDVHAHKVPLYFLVISRVKKQSPPHK